MQKKEVINEYISLILKLGTYLSVVVLLVGFLLLIFFPSPIEAKPFHLSELISQLLKLNPYAFINLGSMILIFTPILRVIVAIISFALARDEKYILISTGVFLILIANIIFFNF